ncbi:LysM peptidoglycan-binding domain-containing protein [Pedobacter panaciterrae]|uniref:LysM peptidoglycan-binding domain-containing protein n=1 Tax=Pedobacter panaciterrae TaxID=363849 RepID=A0ABU8NUK3_9SPHI
MIYSVVKGDTLSRIATKFGVPISSLIILNNITDPNRLFIGQELQVPNIQDVPANATFTAPTSANSLVARARSVIGSAIEYRLGAGGMLPTLPKPSSDGFCDCSGFVCWVLGLSRQTKSPFYKNFGGWIYTDSMEADVKATSGIFDKLSVPEPGCIVVYGALEKIGHVGIVSEVTGGKMSKVVHCSSGNSRRFEKRAIQETLPTVFERPDILWGKFVG